MRLCFLISVVLLVLGRGKAQGDEDPVDRCGMGNLYPPSGVIQSPSYPDRFVGSFNCSYVVEVGWNNTLSLKFLDFQMESILRFCGDKWMTISCSYDGSPGTTASVIRRYCGTKRWTSSLMSDNCPFIILQFSSSSDSGFSKFQIEYTVTPKEDVQRENLTEVDCGQTLYDSYSGVITLPSDPNITLARINCNYTIVPGGTHEFGFNVSHLDLLSLTNSLNQRYCDYYSLRIIMTNLDNTKTYHYVQCSGTYSTFLQDPYIPFGAAVSIVLVSNRYDPRNTFQIPYYTNPVESSCGKVYFNDSKGLIKSPHFPFAHPHNLDCYYEVSVGQSKTVALQFLTFDMEGGRTSCTDWLIINCTSDDIVTNNPPSNRKLCGDIKWKSALQFSGCSVLSMGFHADRSVARGGFEIQYSITNRDTQAQDDNETEVDCGVTEFSASNGEIILPVNHRRYLSKINCNYTISLGKNHSILINTSSLSSTVIATSFPLCAYERFSIKCTEGDRRNDEVNICSYHSFRATFIACQTVQVVLRSEYFDLQDTYRIPYKAVLTEDSCITVERYPNSTGIISTPGYPLFYPPNINCNYSISVGQNKSISVSFEYFEVSYSRYYGYGYSSYGYSYGYGYRYGYDRSTDNSLIIKCTGTAGYNPFTDRPLRGFVRWPPVIRFHNCSTLDLYFSVSSHSYRAQSYRGFRLNYTVSETDEMDFADNISALACGRTQFASRYTMYDSLYFPYSSDTPIGKVNCTYNFTFIRDMDITFTRDNLLPAILSLRDCSHERLSFTCVQRDGSSKHEAGSFCRDNLPTFGPTGLTFTDNCQWLLLNLQSAAYNAQMRRYVQYKITIDECGNTTFTGATGTITSPRYPQYYPNSVRCKYTIVLNETDTLAMNISRFELEGSMPTCSYDWVQIQCIGQPIAVSAVNPFINRRLCSERVFPLLTITGCRALTIDFVTDSSATRIGFKMDYSTLEGNATEAVELADACVNTTFENATGVIVSPTFPLSYPREVNCSYVLTAGVNESIALDFRTFNLQGYGRSMYRRSYIYDEYDSLRYQYDDDYMYIARDTCYNSWLWISCLSQANLGRHRYANRRLCGSKLPFRTELPGCRVVSLNFYADAFVDSGSFNVRYWAVPTGSVIIPDECGNRTFDSPSGVIKSPRYPFTYPHDLNCTYTINAQANVSVTLDFQSFRLEGDPYSTSCQYDWLQINCQPYSSNARALDNIYLNRRMCGYRSPFITTLRGCRTITFDFHTDPSSTYAGFIIQYAFNVTEGGGECGPSEFTNSTGMITSPNFPLEYTHNLDCVYTISIPDRQFTTLTFDSLNLEGDGVACEHDWLQINCQPYRTGMAVPENPYVSKRLCGRRDPFTTQLYGCRNVTLIFYTDRSIARGGFRLWYTINSTTGPPISTGIAQSPSYPDRYIGSFNHTVIIEVGWNNTISLKFLDFQMESILRFCGDKWMTISCSYDGTPETAISVIYRYCGTKRWTSSLTSDRCPYATLHYGSSSDSGFTKFKIEYTIAPNEDVQRESLPVIDCGETLYDSSSGVISLPSNRFMTMARINCTYSIVPGGTHEFGFNVSHLDLLTLTKSLSRAICDYESVRIVITNPGDTKSHYYVPCSGTYSTFLQDPYFPFAKAVSISFVSDRYDPRNRFQIPYYTNPIESSCGRTYFNDSTGLIKSPHFPFLHPHNLDCFYEVSVGQNKIVSLEFQTLELEGGRSSCVDWLIINCTSDGTVTNNPPTNRKLCGDIKWQSAMRFSGCSALSMVFHADYSVAKGGFHIQYTIAPRDAETPGDNETEVNCGATDFDETTNEIILPMNRRRYLSKINCNYTISLGKNNSILMNTSALSASVVASSFPMCFSELFMISCIEGDRRNEDTNFCYTHLNRVAYSSCQTVQLVLRSEYFDFKEEYRIPYEVFDTNGACKAVKAYSDSTGTISTPGYPLFYPPNINCTYSITAGQNKTVSLMFDLFEIGFSSYYDYDYDHDFRYRRRRYSYYYDSSTSNSLLIKCVGTSDGNPFTDRPFRGRIRWPSVIRFHRCSTLDLYFATSSYSSRIQEYKGFSLNYTVSSIGELDFADNISALPCGNTEHANSYTTYAAVYLPFAPDIPIGKVDCTYNIAFVPKMEISFTPENLIQFVNASKDCNQDNLTLTCVSADGLMKYTNGPFCRGRIPPHGTNWTFYKNCQSLQLTVKSSAYNPQIHRSFPYRTYVDECGTSTFTGPNGTITSPRYPQNYPISIRCRYTIVLNETDTVTVNISQFDLEGSTSTPCSYDWVLFQCISTNSRSAASPFINRKLCGHHRVFPSFFVSGCRNLTIDFITDTSGSGFGFRIGYSTQESNLTNVVEGDVCGNTTFDNATGIITSPTLTLAFPREVNCTYVITAGLNESVALEFLIFSVLGYSGSRTYNRRRSFMFDEDDEYGYHIPPPDYDDDDDYYSPDSCTSSWLWISCLSQANLGRHRYANRRLCGSKPSFTTELPGCGVVALNFYASVFVESGSFIVKYRSVPTREVIIPDECGNRTFDGPSGTIKSPRYPLEYPHRLNCTYTINVPESNSVTLDFRGFQLEGDRDSTFCQYDWLQINCQPDVSGAPVPQNDYLNRKFCGYRSPFVTTLRRCRTVTLNFHTDSSSAYSGFLAHYVFNLTEGGNECGTSVFTNLTGVIVSPKYPLEHPHELDCTYSIIFQENQYPILNFESIDLEGDGITCGYDWLQINCQPSEPEVIAAGLPGNSLVNKRLCGRRFAFPVHLEGCRNVTLTFFADRSVARTGFKLTYTINSTAGICSTGCSWEPSTATCRCSTTTSPAPKPIPGDVDCGSTSFTNSTGVIMSPNYPLKHPHNLDCLYVISVEENQFATLEFDSLDLEGHGINCTSDWVQVKCLSSGSGKAVPDNQYVNSKLCGNYDPFKIHLSGCHNITLRLFTDSSLSLGGFKVKYTIESTPDASGHTGGNTSGGKIAVIVVLIIVLIVAVPVAIYLWRKRGGFRKSREDEMMLHITDNDDDQEPTESSGGSVFNRVLFTPSSNDRYIHLVEK